MATTDNLSDFLTSVANAIRSKSGSTAQINAQDFANEIENLPSGGESQVPEYMSAKNFTFNGNACTGYVGDNTLPEIIIPKSYSTVTSIETVVGAKVLDKENLSMSIYDFQSATFSDSGTNTQTYTSTSQLQNLSTDFPNDCYLVSMQGSNPFSFDFLQMAFDLQVLQFPININGQSFSDGMTAFDYIMQNDITNVNFSGDVEVIKFVDGNDYQVTSVSGSNNSSGFKNYQNRIILLSNLTSIGDYAFVSCSSLTNITIPSSVTSIGDSAFSGCSSLTSISLPSGVTSIGYQAFYGCTNIIKTEGELQYLKATVDGVLNEYFAVLDTTSTSISTANINANCKIIAGYAFMDCSSLTSIEIPSGVNSIGDYAFRYCSSLTSITFGENSKLASIGSDAFSNCSSLTNIEIPNSVTSIGKRAFYYCSSLTSIEIPSSVTSIGSHTFYKCSSLTSITFGENSQLQSIGSEAFNGCSSLTSIEIPSGVTSIGEYAFFECSGLTSIEIPSSVTSIGRYVFRSCSSLTTMRIEATTPPTLQNTNAISTATTQIQVPMASVDAYKTATNWSNFADIIVGYTE